MEYRPVSKNKVFFLDYAEALFVNLGSMEESKESRNASFSTPGWGKVSFPVRKDGLNTCDVGVGTGGGMHGKIWVSMEDTSFLSLKTTIAVAANLVTMTATVYQKLIMS